MLLDHSETLTQHPSLCQVKSFCGKYIYHIGIIDYLQTYDFGKKSERFLKRLLQELKMKYTEFDKNDFSVIEPNLYQERFIKFCRNKVF